MKRRGAAGALRRRGPPRAHGRPRRVERRAAPPGISGRPRAKAKAGAAPDGGVILSTAILVVGSAS